MERSTKLATAPAGRDQKRDTQMGAYPRAGESSAMAFPPHQDRNSQPRLNCTEGVDNYRHPDLARQLPSRTTQALCGSDSGRLPKLERIIWGLVRVDGKVPHSHSLECVKL